MTAPGREPAGRDHPEYLDALAAEADRALAEADRALAADYPGPRPGRQPVHTAYLPADRFGPALAARWGRDALAALDAWAPGPAEFGEAMGLPDRLAADVRSRVLAKLVTEPVGGQVRRVHRLPPGPRPRVARGQRPVGLRERPVRLGGQRVQELRSFPALSAGRFAARGGHGVSVMCSGLIGIRDRSSPVAARIAAAIAGPEEIVGGSPTPRRP